MASGLPLELTSNTLQVWLTVAGVSLQEIGLLTLAGAAYTLKFLWSPLVDRYAPPGLGRRRGWIFLTQWLLALALVGMGLLSPRESLGTLALLAVMVAFFPRRRISPLMPTGPTCCNPMSVAPVWPCPFWGTAWPRWSLAAWRWLPPKNGWAGTTFTS